MISMETPFYPSVVCPLNGGGCMGPRCGMAVDVAEGGGRFVACAITAIARAAYLRADEASESRVRVRKVAYPRNVFERETASGGDA